MTNENHNQEIEIKNDETLLTLYDEEGNELDAARHPLQIIQIKVDQPIYPNNMMRKEV